MNFFPRSRVAFLTIFGALLTARGAEAQVRIVELEPARTQIQFTLKDVLHTVHGTFQLKSGEVRFDPTSGTADGAVIVDATSGNSGSNARDNKMHKEILESWRYPEISFLPRKVTGAVSLQGAAQVQVQGIFRMHGSDHNLTLTIPIQTNGNQVSATTQFEVPYVAWGLQNPSTFILRVSNKVQISIAASGQVVANETRQLTTP